METLIYYQTKDYKLSTSSEILQKKFKILKNSSSGITI